MNNSMNPRVIKNEAQDLLKLCPGDEEPEDLEEAHKQLIDQYINEIRMITKRQQELESICKV